MVGKLKLGLRIPDVSVRRSYAGIGFVDVIVFQSW